MSASYNLFTPPGLAALDYEALGIWQAFTCPDDRVILPLPLPQPGAHLANQTVLFQLLDTPPPVDWTVVRLWQDGEDDNIYRYEDIDLSSFAMTREFWVAFDAGMSGTGDYFWVDDLKVVSQAIPAPVAQNSDTKGPGILFVSGGLIAGGTYTIEFIWHAISSCG